MNAKDYFGYTPMHMAITKNNKDIIRLLINAGADVNVMDQMGSSLLHQAIEKKNIEIFKMILSAGMSHLFHHLLRSTYPLIYAGANVNVVDRYGETPLHLAVEKNNTVIIKLLVDAGADESIRNMYGRTPFASCKAKALSNANTKMHANKLVKNGIVASRKQ